MSKHPLVPSLLGVVAAGELFVGCLLVFSARFSRLSVRLRAQKADLPGFVVGFSTSSVSLSDFPVSHPAGSEARTGAGEDRHGAAFSGCAQLSRLRDRGLTGSCGRRPTAPEGWSLLWAWGAGGTGIVCSVHRHLLLEGRVWLLLENSCLARIWKAGKEKHGRGGKNPLAASWRLLVLLAGFAGSSVGAGLGHSTVTWPDVLCALSQAGASRECFLAAKTPHLQLLQRLLQKTSGLEAHRQSEGGGGHS